MKIIKIRRDSIKKNPNAGRTRYCIPGRDPYVVDSSVCLILDSPFNIEEWKGLLPEIIRNEVCWYDSIRIEDGLITIVYHFSTHDKELLKQIVSKKEIIPFAVNFPEPILIESILPEPDYHYEYEDPGITCFSCGKKSKLSELGMYEMVNEDGDDFSYNVCPHCESSDLEECVHEEIYTIPKSELP